MKRILGEQFDQRAAGHRFKRIYDRELNAKWFDAKGDGSTDDTAAIRLAIAELRNGDSLYFPAGEYIIDSGCLLFRGLSNVSIYGDGANSWLHPSGQRTPTTKTFFHTTVAIDQCANVAIRDLRIESKGQHWGNTDAGNNAGWGDGRTNFAIEKGGHALLVSRSAEVVVSRIVGRLCGSVGVYYFSSCQEVVVRDCFANASSLGYAAYAVDNWCDPDLNLRRTYNFIDCNCWNEEGYSLYSAKAGILVEGDPGRILSVNVQGGIFKDCTIGGDHKTMGCAVGSVYSNTTLHGVTSESCLIGFLAGARGSNSEHTVHTVVGCSFLNNKVAGIMLDFKAPGAGDHQIFVKDTVIKMRAISNWVEYEDWRVKYTSGLANLSYLNGNIHLSNVSIYGGSYGIYSMDHAVLDCRSSEISGIKNGVNVYGGGRHEFYGTSVSSEEEHTFAFRTANITLTGASTATRELHFTVVHSTLNSGIDQTLFSISAASGYLKSVAVKDNLVKNGFTALSGVNAVSKTLDDMLKDTAAVVTSVGWAGTNTAVHFALPPDKHYLYTRIIDETGTIHPIQVSYNDFGSRGVYRIVLLGDIRSSFPVNAICRLISL